MAETFRVVRSTTPTPSALTTTRRHSTSESAVAEMADGIVVGVAGSTLRLVAFHERHLAYVERTAGVVRISS